MSYSNKKQLEALRPTVTGVGWANTQQGAIYTGIGHRKLCDLIASGRIVHSRVGKSTVRIRYSDLDEYMLSLRVEMIDVKAITARVLKKIGLGGNHRARRK